MSLASDLLNPQGRISRGAFLKSGLILIAVAFVLSLLALVNPIVSTIATLVSLLLIYPWVVIWVKRLHQANTSGWMFLLILLLYVIAIMVLSVVLILTLTPDFFTAAASGDQAAAQAASMEMQQRIMFPAAICSAIVSLVFLFLGNALLKSEPGPNRFGPPPAA